MKITQALKTGYNIIKGGSDASSQVLDMCLPLSITFYEEGESETAEISRIDIITIHDKHGEKWVNLTVQELKKLLQTLDSTKKIKKIKLKLEINDTLKMAGLLEEGELQIKTIHDGEDIGITARLK